MKKLKFLSKKFYLIVGGIVALCLLALLVFILIYRDRIENPIGTIGNTSGNLYNDGLFCEYDGMVYFSNIYDKNRLYCCDLNEEKMTRLTDVPTQNILAGGTNIYFFQNGDANESDMASISHITSFARFSLKGKKQTSLLRDIVLGAQLIDNYLYLDTVSPSSKVEFIKKKIDQSEAESLTSFELLPYCYKSGLFYYAGTENDHNLYAYDPETKRSSPVLRQNVWYPTLDGDFIYFLDVDNNYSLARYSLVSKEVTTVTEERVDCFNVGNGYIYYQRNSLSGPAALICMTTDLTDKTIVAEGNYTSINLTSKYVYFKEFGNETALFHSRLGQGNFSPFSKAQYATFK